MARALALLLLALQTACTAWRPLPSRGAIPADRVRIVTTSDTLEIRNATIEADSLLLGTVVSADGEGRLFRVPLSEIVRIEERRIHAFRTGLLVYLGVGAVLGIICADRC